MLAIIVIKSDPKAPISRGVGEGTTPFPGLLHFTLNPYLIMLSQARRHQVPFFFLVFGVTQPGIEHSTNYQLGQWADKVKLATLVEDYPKAPLSIATTPKCRGRLHSIPWIAPFYPWSVPYSAEC